jgi:hypothetical protein
VRFEDYLPALELAPVEREQRVRDVLAWLAASSGRGAPNVVMPSYMPAKLYRAALAAGCGRCREVAGVPGRRRGRGAADRRTIALFHVHYFGFPGDVEDTRGRRGAPSRSSRTARSP